MEGTIDPYDVVVLTTDLPKYNLQRGQVGTVVDILTNGAAYEVEFSHFAEKFLAKTGATEWAVS